MLHSSGKSVIEQISEPVHPHDSVLRVNLFMSSEKLIVWFDKAMAFCFYALIYFLPISIALLEIFTGFALLFFLCKRGVIFYGQLKGQVIAWGKFTWWGRTKVLFQVFQPVPCALNKPIVLLLIFCFVSVLTSQYPHVSFKGFMGKSLQNAFLFFTFLECIKSSHRLRKFLTFFLLSITLVLLSGIYQYHFGADFIHAHRMYDERVSSSFRSPNDFGAYLIFVIPVILGILISTAGKSGGRTHFFKVFYSLKTRTALFMLLILALLNLVFSASRGAWFGLISSLALFGLRNKKMFVSTVVLILAGAMLVFITKDQRYIFTQFNEIFIDNGRLNYWKEAVLIIKDHLIFGVGLNAYSLVAPQYKISWGGYPHNCYLQMAAEIGFVGLASFLWLIAAVCGNALQKMNSMQDPWFKFLLLGFLTGLAGFLIHGFWDTIFYSVPLSSLMWIYFGIIEVIPKIAEKENQNLS